MRGMFTVLLFAAATLTGCADQEENVRVAHPWILEAPSGTDRMAGYGALHNDTGEAVVVEALESPAFERVHLHETRIEEGQARMVPVDALTVPPGGRAVMHPGGLHLMLMSPKRPLERGDEVEIRFHLSTGVTLSAEFTVRQQPPG